MFEQRPDIIRTLTDFFIECGGAVGHYRPIAGGDLSLYEELLRYRLVMLEDHEDEEDIRWTAALTDEGRQFCHAYLGLEEDDTQTLPIQENLTLNFNLRQEQDAEVFVFLRDLIETGDPIMLLSRMLRLYTLVDAGNIDGLMAHFPNLVEAMRETLASEQDEQEQQQLTQLLTEMSAVKALLRGQPVSASQFNVLHPVIPQEIEGGPKKLDVPQFEVPAYEEDDESSELFIVEPDIHAGKRAAENFLKSLRSLQEHHVSESE